MQLAAATFPDMGIVEKIHHLKQGHRPHFIQQWAKARGMEQKDIVSELNVDKSVVSRWFSGSTPSMKYQEVLAELFGTEREGLFRHPAEARLATFMSGRSPEEVERIMAMLEAGFPKSPSIKN
jgi:transcriptional regulator with XRE-family HTH domain